MRIFIQSNDYKLLLIVKNGCGVPMKKVSEVNVPKTEEEFTDEDCKKMELNAKAINMIYCGVNADDYRKISRCETAKQMWEKLEVTYEGTAQVREAKINHLTHEYELFSMKENEKIEEMFERFSNVINPLNLLGKTYTDRELVRKVLRSLSPKWSSKVDAIEEGRDFQTTTYDSLRGNLITYETIQLSKVVEERNKRSIALPATTSTHNNVDDDSDNTDLGLFVRKLKKMMLKKGAKKNTPPKCYGCGEIGHIKPMCPKLKNEKDKRAPKNQRAYISWENDGSGSEDSETEEVANLCLMAIEDGDTSKEVSDQEPSPNDPLTLDDVVCIVEDLILWINLIVFFLCISSAIYHAQFLRSLGLIARADCSVTVHSSSSSCRFFIYTMVKPLLHPKPFNQGRGDVKKSAKPSSKKLGTVTEEAKSKPRLDSIPALKDVAKEVSVHSSSSSSAESSSSSPLETPPNQVLEEGVTVDSALKVFDKLPDSAINEKGPPKSTFAQLFEGNKVPANGMKLKYYDVGDGDVLDIPDEIIKPVEDIWGFCLVGCFTGRFPGLKAVDSVVKQWGVACKIIPHCKGWVVLRFEDEAARQQVLAADRAVVFGKEFRLKIPGHCFMFDFSEFTTMPTWIKLPNLPMQLWSDERIGYVASKVGKPICTDVVSKEIGKARFCRVLVDLDLSKKPRTSITTNVMGKTYIQEVVYEDQLRYCYHCKCRGHSPLSSRVLEELHNRCWTLDIAVEPRLDFQKLLEQRCRLPNSAVQPKPKILCIGRKFLDSDVDPETALSGQTSIFKGRPKQRCSRIGEGQSTSRPPLFDGTNYSYWKERMRIYIRSTNFQLWLVIKNGEEIPMKKVGETTVPKTENEFDVEDIKKIENYAKAINMLYCAVNPDDYRKISCCTTAKEMWDKLEVTYEGTDQVREAKIDFLTQEYEMFRMKEVSNVTIDGLRGNLKTYESTILTPSLDEQKKKGIALKATKEPVEEASSDDDNEFGLVIKKFHKFMKKEFERKGRKHDGPPKCYGCGEIGHIKPRYPKAKHGKDKPGFKKQRAYISWGSDSGDETTDQEEDEAANLCLMANEDQSDDVQEDKSRAATSGKTKSKSRAPTTSTEERLYYGDGSYLWFDSKEERTRFLTFFSKRVVAPPRIIPERYPELQGYDDLDAQLHQAGLWPFLGRIAGLPYQGDDVSHYGGEDWVLNNEGLILNELGITELIRHASGRPTIHSANPEGRLLLYIVSRIIKPRKHGHTIMSVEDLKLIHAIMHSAPINWAKFVMINMTIAASTDHDHLLPYPFVVMDILERFKVTTTVGPLTKATKIWAISTQTFKKRSDNVGPAIAVPRPRSAAGPAEPQPRVNLASIADSLNRLHFKVDGMDGYLERLDEAVQRQGYAMNAYFQRVNYVPPPYHGTFYGQVYGDEDEDDASYDPSSSPDEDEFDDAVDGDEMDVDDEEEETKDED
ncbi:unnamed protein product [Cuscuta campestris]|uniref:CCHC-type domain-containing protein n=1 Tax=Cuscuta campestris TaxID=132261 RepID=A0A484LLC8_9ASTE|nr:unnamed protein product [Cuscuta campestris]